MALRLRKDVQKASYYVWFLGAEEARGLRGPRVLLPAIPHLIERAREQEPLKVTLQVSQKGMKIVQGTSKHFITHSAITCSVQTDDIVACVLLLYNPTTKCPLHVHAYRCDSETTAQALHQFLQVLINRPENQKRFAELEARLGLQAMSVSSPTTSRSLSSPEGVSSTVATTSPATGSGHKSHNPNSHHANDGLASPLAGKTPVRRFESSLGSDTGTSTRESECSEELLPPPLTNGGSPGALPKSSLYDSLAAELRAKLNGNGPPLLLPPRDYDTVHRSKGNLAATELRRCRNSLIVGDKVKKQQLQLQQQQQQMQQQQTATALTTRSRGSSGIGSDLAPSPERPIEHSSSDEEEWIPSVNHHLAVEADSQPFAQQLSPPRKSAATRQSSYPFKDHQHFEQGHHSEHQHQAEAAQPPSYLYPSARDHHDAPPTRAAKSPYSPGGDAAMVAAEKRGSARSSSREKGPIIGGVMPSTSAPHHAINHHQSHNNEQDIRPIIIRPRTYDSRFKHVLDERQFKEAPAPGAAGDRHEDVHHHGGAHEHDVDDNDDIDCCEEVPHKHHGAHHHEKSHAIGISSKPIERQYRTAEEVQLKSAGSSAHHRVSRSPQPQQNYRYGDAQALPERHASRSSGSGGAGKAAFDYRENLTDREKYRESQKYNNHHMYKDHHQPHPQQHPSMHEYPAPLHQDASAMRSRKSYAEPTASSVHDTPAPHQHQRRDASASASRTRDPYQQSEASGGVKLSRSFKDKTANVEYHADGQTTAPPNAPISRNPYKEPDSLPYRESIERMLKSPVMRYKSFESDAAPAIRYQNYADEPSAPPLQRRHQPRSGSPDTVCRVSPKDRFNNAKEKFEAMERERNYTQPRNTSMMLAMSMSHEEPSVSASRRQHHQQQQLQQQQQSSHRHHSPSPPRQQQQQQRFPMLDGADHEHSSKLDWSSEDEQHQLHQLHHHHQQQHQQQQHHSRHHSPGAHNPVMASAAHHSSSRYPVPDPYGSPLDAPMMGRGAANSPAALGGAKSLNNLVRGYRHSYAEPRHQAPPLPRNSGRVGLAAVNPF